MANNEMTSSEVKNIVRKELKNFLKSTDVHNTVINLVQKELKDKKNDKRIVELSTKVIVELFKNLWTKKSFWEGSLKNVR